MSDNRVQVLEYRNRLYAAKDDIACDAMLRIAKLELATLDRRLRKCGKEELQTLQGEIAAWEKIQKYIQDNPQTTKSLT